MVMRVLRLVACYAREMMERHKGGVAFDLRGRRGQQVNVRKRAVMWACAGTPAITALIVVRVQTRRWYLVRVGRVRVGR